MECPGVPALVFSIAIILTGTQADFNIPDFEFTSNVGSFDSNINTQQNSESNIKENQSFSQFTSYQTVEDNQHQDISQSQHFESHQVLSQQDNTTNIQTQNMENYQQQSFIGQELQIETTGTFRQNLDNKQDAYQVQTSPLKKVTDQIQLKIKTEPQIIKTQLQNHQTLTKHNSHYTKIQKIESRQRKSQKLHQQNITSQQSESQLFTNERNEIEKLQQQLKDQHFESKPVETHRQQIELDNQKIQNQEIGNKHSQSQLGGNTKLPPRNQFDIGQNGKISDRDIHSNKKHKKKTEIIKTLTTKIHKKESQSTKDETKQVYKNHTQNVENQTKQIYDQQSQAIDNQNKTAETKTAKSNDQQYLTSEEQTVQIIITETDEDSTQEVQTEQNIDQQDHVVQNFGRDIPTQTAEGQFPVVVETQIQGPETQFESNQDQQHESFEVKTKLVNDQQNQTYQATSKQFRDQQTQSVSTQSHLEQYKQNENLETKAKVVRGKQNKLESEFTIGQEKENKKINTLIGQSIDQHQQNIETQTNQFQNEKSQIENGKIIVIQDQNQQNEIIAQVKNRTNHESTQTSEKRTTKIQELQTLAEEDITEKSDASDSHTVTDLHQTIRETSQNMESGDFTTNVTEISTLEETEAYEGNQYINTKTVNIPIKPVGTSPIPTGIDKHIEPPIAIIDTDVNIVPSQPQESLPIPAVRAKPGQIVNIQPKPPVYNQPRADSPPEKSTSSPCKLGPSIDGAVKHVKGWVLDINLNTIYIDDENRGRCFCSCGNSVLLDDIQTNKHYDSLKTSTSTRNREPFEENTHNDGQKTQTGQIPPFGHDDPEIPDHGMITGPSRHTSPKDPYEGRRGRYHLDPGKKVQGVELEVNLSTVLVKGDDGGRCLCSCGNSIKPHVLTLQRSQIF